MNQLHILPYEIGNLDTLTLDRLFQFIGTLLAIFIFTKFVDKTSFISIGLHLKHRTIDIIAGFFLGILIMVIGCFSLFYLHEIELNYNTHINKSAIAYSFIFYTFVAFMEEVLCRGYVLGQLLNVYDKYLSLIITSIFFAALHMFNPNIGTIPLLNLFLAGVLLGITYIHTKNLWFPIALHLSWNFFQGPIFGFGVSGFSSYSIVEQVRTKDNYINGGHFGFEGSLLGSLLMLISIFIIDWYYRRKTVR
ncbi:CPBP family intramembrane glutamic endopeptidase [uncultured Kordia sp.]|uniref:CPBP family intramembrane glutamic endopeptidase n=1 Tax=uncultured Kordia sp. TaxID=507699 RepID=UPI00260ECE9F|nr:CPBP family intramembrane glutamic endopeptidase [uncultured Kordia sp.]